MFSPSCYECTVCNHIFAGSESYDDDPKTRDCPECRNAKGQIKLIGRKMNAQIMSDLEPFKSPVTNQMITGRYQLREHLKETGCRIVDPSEAKDHGIKERQE